MPDIRRNPEQIIEVHGGHLAVLKSDGGDVWLSVTETHAAGETYACVRLDAAAARDICYDLHEAYREAHA